MFEPLKNTDANKDTKNVFFVFGGAVITDIFPYVPIGIGKSKSPLSDFIYFSPNDNATGG